MKLNLTYGEIFRLLKGGEFEDHSKIDFVSIDSRTILNGDHCLFIAFKGSFRDGNDFVLDAYERGVRHFISSSQVELPFDAKNIHVDDVLLALQEIAKFHRSKYNIPVIGITGSNGKTTVKEWLSELLSIKYQVLKSPKSYNSQIGVALSLLELTPTDEIAVIEAGISEPGEMATLRALICPTHGILTNIGSAHLQNFNSPEELFQEKMELFEGLETIFTLAENNFSAKANFVKLELIDTIPKHLDDKISRKNLALASGVAKFFSVEPDEIAAGIAALQPLANRLERFDGKNNNLIINDSYSLDETALRLSLESQISIAEGKERVVIIALENKNVQNEIEFARICEEYAVNKLIFHVGDDALQLQFENSCILIKGARKAHAERIASRLRLKKHQTFLEIDLRAIRHNIVQFKSLLNPETKLMTMVKASSYGSDAEKMALWLEKVGVEYLGVAYTEEGVELRKKGVTLPIMVMNVDEFALEDCIAFSLEPAIFSVGLLEKFISELIYNQISHYPIHIKLETGMNRLGFCSEELPRLLSVLKSQPEVYVRSIYSHLATADSDKDYAERQIEIFDALSSRLCDSFNYKVLRHILNSEGIARYPYAQFDMVRLGIGMYGISNSSNLAPNLENALCWYSTVSQVKLISIGESVGYDRSFIAKRDSKIAVIPVGYADGYNRKLGNNVGEVYINGNKYPVIGNVCMDMTMIDITDNEVSAGDMVELFGQHISVHDLAKKIGTIPYEIFTSVSSRVLRTYIED